MIREFCNLRSKHQAVFAILIVVAVVEVWRGVWGLRDQIGAHFLPDNPELDFILSIIVGLVILGATHYMVKELT